jgi:hypothetical protein
LGANIVGNQKVHYNLDVYPVQNVEHSHNVQSHEIPDLSLDYWRRVFASVNVSDDASHVHTIMKDSKAIQVKRLFAADLEGSCGDFGTNGLEGCFRPENSHLQHLTHNGHNHTNVQSHEIPYLSLDYWKVSAAVNASDDASPVHTVVKDIKAIQVRRLFVADLEGSCGDFGTNGLEGCFRHEKSDLQHLTQNGGKINTCQSLAIINIHQKLSQLQKELTPSPVAFLPFFPFHFSASARRTLASSSSFSSISFRILASFHLVDSFTSLLASASSIRRCCFNLFDSSSLSYIHEMQLAHL